LVSGSAHVFVYYSSLLFSSTRWTGVIVPSQSLVITLCIIALSSPINVVRSAVSQNVTLIKMVQCCHCFSLPACY